MLSPFQFFIELTKTKRSLAVFGRESEATDQSTMSGTGMTQEMEALAFEGDEGVELTEEEAEESARLYDEAQVVLQTEHDRNPAKTA